MISKRVLLLSTILALLLANAFAAVLDPLSTAATTFEYASRDHNVPAQSSGFWGSNYQRPFPTNSWWQNVVLNGVNPIKPNPYTLRCDSDGFHVCFPSRVTAQAYTLEAFVDNWIVGTTQGLGTRQVVANDDLSVRVQYSSGGGSIVSPIVRGQAYHTVEYNGLTPKLRTIHAIISVNGGGGGSYSGTKLKIKLNNGQTWLVYTSSSVTWSQSGSTLTATNTFNGALRLAYLQDDGAEGVFDANSAAYPTGGQVSVTVANNLATILFTFAKKGGSNPLLMFTLPHHQDVIKNANYASPQVRYRVLKGYMLANIGDTWRMEEPLVTDIGFDSRYTVPSGNIEALRQQLYKDQNSYPAPTDPYFGGKAVARLGRLACIADELGETAIATKIRNNMKTYFNKWINVGWNSGDNKLVYDKTWGGLVSLRSVGSDSADFGMYYYNDHHFHYGYFIYAAAAIIKKDVAWGQTYYNKIMEIVRDVANPSGQDPSFPKLRNKDWFTGHSYAAGLFGFGDSRNQESTSEAINAYYGVYCLGLALNNADLRDLGRVLMQTEIRSSQKYWHIQSKDNIYDAPFSNNKVVGVLWETKTDYATFFGGNVEYIHGIQMMPYTPITEDYLTPDWLRESYPVWSTAYTRGNAAQGWLGILYQAQATFDKAGAASRIATLSGVDDGNTMTNTVYWLYTRPDGSNTKRSNPFANIDAYKGGSSPSPSPTPSPTPSPAPSPTPSPSPSPTPSPSPSPTPSPSPSPSTGCATCGSGTVICGSTCINSDRYDCCSDNTAASKGQCSTTPAPAPSPTPSPAPSPSTDAACANVQCSAGMSCCNGACYNPGIYGCFDGMLCPTGTQRCGNACFNTDIFICCGTTLKPKGQSC